MIRNSLAALAALSLFALAPPAAAADKPVFVACNYQANDGVIYVSYLFAVDSSDIDDGYGRNFDKIADWERQFPMPEYSMQRVGSFSMGSFIDQFAQYAKSKGDDHSDCWLTTTKERSEAWRAKLGGGRKVVVDTEWRPAKAKVFAIEDWNGHPVAK